MYSLGKRAEVMSLSRVRIPPSPNSLTLLEPSRGSSVKLAQRAKRFSKSGSPRGSAAWGRLSRVRIPPSPNPGVPSPPSDAGDAVEMGQPEVEAGARLRFEHGIARDDVAMQASRELRRVTLRPRLGFVAAAGLVHAFRVASPHKCVRVAVVQLGEDGTRGCAVTENFDPFERDRFIEQTFDRAAGADAVGIRADNSAAEENRVHRLRGAGLVGQRIASRYHFFLQRICHVAASVLLRLQTPDRYRAAAARHSNRDVTSVDLGFLQIRAVNTRTCAMPDGIANKRESHRRRSRNTIRSKNRKIFVTGKSLSSIG